MVRFSLILLTVGLTFGAAAQQASDTVWVSGAMNQPGLYRVSERTTVAEVLTLAGGTTSIAADQVLIVAGNTRLTQLDLERLSKSGNRSTVTGGRVTRLNPTRFPHDRKAV